ncbi:MAG: hypothetical protein ACYC4S_09915 [Rhodoferax sp.]
METEKINFRALGEAAIALQKRPPRPDPAQCNAEKNCDPIYCALEFVTKPNLSTAEAAFYLNRRPQTMRTWAMRDGTGPIRPRRIGGILAWNTSEVKTLAGVA